MKIIYTLALILCAITLKSQDFGWRTLYSANGREIQYRIFIGDQSKTKSWETTVYFRTTFEESVNFAAIADVAYPNDRSYEGKTKMGASIGWGVLYEGNNRENYQVYDYVRFSNIRFERLKIGDQTLIRNGQILSDYVPGSRSSGENDSSEQRDGQEAQREQEAREAAYRAEQERQDQLEQERRQREEYTRRADEASRRLQDAANQNSDPVMKSMYESNRRNGENISDPQERQRFLNQQAQLAEQSARNQQAINDLSAAATTLASIEVDELAQSDMLWVVGGGISNLASPYFVSNRTTSSTGNPINWFFNMSLLNRTGLSFMANMGSLNQVNEKFVVYTTSTDGDYYPFDGELNSKATHYQFSLGKDLFSKSGRFHMFLGGSVGHLSFDSHDWTYASNKFTETKIGYGLWSGGINGQVFVFFSQRLGLNVGANYNLFFKKVEDTQFYRTNNYLVWNAGLVFRLL